MYATYTLTLSPPVSGRPAQTGGAWARPEGRHHSQKREQAGLPALCVCVRRLPPALTPSRPCAGPDGASGYSGLRPGRGIFLRERNSGNGQSINLPFALDRDAAPAFPD